MTIALAQIRVDPGEPAINLPRAERSIVDARRRGAEWVVLPEVLDCGWTHPSARDLAGSIPGGEACERLRAAARDAGVHVCAGIAERSGSDLFNAAILISPEGDVLVHHRKIHELDFARELYTTGDRLSVAATPFGRVGVMICADAFAPEYPVSRSLGLMGARLIVSPCSWAVDATHDNEANPYGGLWLECYGVAAAQFQLRIAAASHVGPLTAGAWAGRHAIGCSMVIGPDGQPIVRGPYGESSQSILLARLPDFR